MSTQNAVAVRPQEAQITELPRPDGSVRQGLQTIDDGRRRLWAQLFFEGCTDEEAEFCFAFCAHRDLDPLRGEVVFTKFQKKDRNGRVTGYTVTPVVTAVGYRVQASRSGDYLGQTPREWCGKDGVWRQVWLEDAPPAAARVGVLRRGCPQPIYAVAVFKRFCKTYDGKPSGLWATHPDVMIATRAETAAFKLAFPETRREEDAASRVTYRQVATGVRLREIGGAVVDDGGAVFDALADAEELADRDLWTEANRDLHRLVAILHPEEPDAHAIVHELVCARFGVDSTKDATADQLATLADEIGEQLPDDDNHIGGNGEIVDTKAARIASAEAAEVVDADTGEIVSGSAPVAEPNEKIVATWLGNINRARTTKTLDKIAGMVANVGLAAHRDLKSALEIKRAELEAAAEAATNRAVDDAMVP